MDVFALGLFWRDGRWCGVKCPSVSTSGPDGIFNGAWSSSNRGDDSLYGNIKEMHISSRERAGSSHSPVLLITTRRKGKGK